MPRRSRSPSATDGVVVVRTTAAASRSASTDGQGRPRGRPHRAPRRRQVRRRRLQGLGRSPRRRRQRGQRAVLVAARRVRARRAHLGARSTSAASRPDRSRSSVRRATDTARRRCSCRPRDVRDDRVHVRTDQPASARVGVPDQGRVDHASSTSPSERERSFYFEGGLQSLRPAPQPEQGRPAHPADLRRAARGLDRGRGRPAVQRHATPRTCSRSPTTSTRSMAAPTSPASAPR